MNSAKESHLTQLFFSLLDLETSLATFEKEKSMFFIQKLSQPIKHNKISKKKITNQIYQRFHDFSSQR